MTEAKTKKSLPSHTVYFVSDRDNAAWVAVGAAWSHQDGEGLTLKLDLLPNVPGRIVLRTYKAKDTASAEQQDAA